jgi:hypothetical protein
MTWGHWTSCLGRPFSSVSLLYIPLQFHCISFSEIKCLLTASIYIGGDKEFGCCMAVFRKTIELVSYGMFDLDISVTRFCKVF